MKGKAFGNAVKKFFSERKYAIWLLLWVVVIVWYFLLNQFQTDAHVIHMAVDDKIPFVEYFIVPYCLWYPYVAFAFLWLLFTSKRDFLTLCSLVYIALFSSLLIFTLYPSMHTMRPASGDMPNNLFSYVVKGIYAVDKPRAILPSQHCYLVIVVSVCLLFSDTFKGKLWPKIFCPVFSVLVMLSTVFIKQHSFADVLLAMAMSVPTCLLTYFVFVPKRRFVLKAPVAEPSDAPSARMEEREEGEEQEGEDGQA